MRTRLTAILFVAVASTAGCSPDQRKVLGDQCDLNSECEAPLVCRLQRCRRECNATRDCPIGQLCVRDNEKLGACLLPEETRCELDSECPEPLVCRGSSCSNECAEDRDCAPGARCVTDADGAPYCEDLAREPCRYDSDCAPLICGRDGLCRDECVESRDCREGLICIAGACVLSDGGVALDGGTNDGGPGDAGEGDGGPPPDVVIARDAPSCSEPSDCVTANATTDCVEGSCAIVACEGGFTDCDQLWTGGCEADLQTDAWDCGSCGRRCASCVAGECEAPVQIAYGNRSGCARFPSGTVSCWGSNGFGILGDGTTDARDFPKPMIGIDSALDVDLGPEHACVLVSGGRILCTGRNSGNQIGDGTFTARSVPTAAMGPFESPAALAAGSGATCAIDSSDVRCWGINGGEVLGVDLGTTTSSATALPLAVADATSIALGGQHACVGRSGGTVQCWGTNMWGLGDGTTTTSQTPVTVSGLTDVSAVGRASGGHQCAVRSGGEVACWGLNFAGQLGDGTTDDSASPVAVDGLTDATAVIAGPASTCAIRDGGQVVCWGRNNELQLGDSAIASTGSPTPVPVPGVTDAVALSASRDDLFCAIRATGAVTCWGNCSAVTCTRAAFGPTEPIDLSGFP